MKEALAIYFDQTYNNLTCFTFALSLYVIFSAMISDNFEHYLKTKKSFIILALFLIAILILMPSKEVIDLLPI